MLMIKVCGWILAWILVGELGFRWEKEAISHLLDAKVNGIENKYLWMLATTFVAMVICPIIGIIYCVVIVLCLILILGEKIGRLLIFIYNFLRKRQPQVKSC